ncbi:hypothetical protein D3C76_1097490 [compost metagenome]
MDSPQRVDGRKAGAKIEEGAAETEQQATENGDERPPEELQQAHQGLWISK